MKKVWISFVIAVLLAGSVPISASAVGESVSGISASAETATEVVMDGLTYYLYDDHAEVGAGKNKSIETADIVSEVNGIPVTVVRKQGFMMCFHLKQVTIPEGITTLETQAFASCAFTQITLPDSLTTIKGNAFSMCSSLTELYIPAQVKTIGNCAFSDCSSLQKFTVADENLYFSVREDVLYSKDGTTLIWYPPAKAVSSFVILDTVRTISGFAFLGAENLEEIIIPDNVRNLGINTFGNCTALQHCTIPEGITTLGSCLFFGCSNLSNVEIPDTVTTIQGSVFSNCSNLSSVQLPEKLTQLGDGAFQNCTSLTEIAIPKTVTELGKYTFQNCTALKYFAIPEQVTKLEEHIFAGCSGLKSIVIPVSVTEIDKAAFSQCSSLEEVTILNPNCVLFDDAETICNTLAEDGSPIFSGIISGYENSTAQAYAEKYGLLFNNLGKAPVWEIGDVNLDGTVSMADVVMLQKYLLRKQPFTQQQGQFSDINEDNAVQVLDLILLKQKILKK